MSLLLQRANYFNRDLDLQHQWFLANTDEILAGRYLNAVLSTLRMLSTQPDLGHLRNFRHPSLCGIRSFRVSTPFQAYLLFYHHNSTTLFAERLMHGARNLPRRLTEPPDAAEAEIEQDL